MKTLVTAFLVSVVLTSCGNKNDSSADMRNTAEQDNEVKLVGEEAKAFYNLFSKYAMTSSQAGATRSFSAHFVKCWDFSAGGLCFVTNADESRSNKMPENVNESGRMVEILRNAGAPLSSISGRAISNVHTSWTKGGLDSYEASFKIVDISNAVSIDQFGGSKSPSGEFVYVAFLKQLPASYTGNGGCYIQVTVDGYQALNVRVVGSLESEPKTNITTIASGSNRGVGALTKLKDRTVTVVGIWINNEFVARSITEK